MADPAGEASETVWLEAVCPHCRKAFTAELLGGGPGRYRGVKCPHCKLFVPAERAEPGPGGEG